jgi:hypothetical protein
MPAPIRKSAGLVVAPQATLGGYSGHFHSSQKGGPSFSYVRKARTDATGADARGENGTQDVPF